MNSTAAVDRAIALHLCPRCIILFLAPKNEAILKVNFEVKSTLFDIDINTMHLHIYIYICVYIYIYIYVHMQIIERYMNVL
jgi:hypothetical protein